MKRTQGLRLLAFLWVASWPVTLQADSNPYFRVAAKLQIAYPGTLYADGDRMISVARQTQPEGISVFDISNPGNPIAISERSMEDLGVKIVDWNRGVAFQGGECAVRWPHVFIPDVEGLHGYDFSDPNDPQKLFDYQNPTLTYYTHAHVAVRDDAALFLYPIAEKVEERWFHYLGCDVLDISNVRSPQLLSTTKIPCRGYDFAKIHWIREDCVYISSAAWMVSTYRSLTEPPSPAPVICLDLSDRLNPTASVFEPEEYLGASCVVGDRLYLRAFKEKLGVRFEPYWLTFDISNPSEPRDRNVLVLDDSPSIVKGDGGMYVLFPEEGGNNALILLDDLLYKRLVSDFPAITSSAPSMVGYRTVSYDSGSGAQSAFLMSYQLEPNSNVWVFMRYK